MLKWLLTIAIVVVILGLLTPVLCFAWNPGAVATLAVLSVCLVGVIIGCKLLWPDSPDGRHRPGSH